METKIINGNIADSTTDITVHQVNCQFVMGSGVAKVLRDKYPIIYDEYMRLKEENLEHQTDPLYLSHNYMGKSQFVHIGNNKYIVNLFGQDRYGYDGQQYTSYDAVECGLYNVKRNLLFNQKFNSIHTIAFPWGMGAGRGGASWVKIREIIEKVFSNMNITIIYYQLDPNKKFN